MGAQWYYNLILVLGALLGELSVFDGIKRRDRKRIVWSAIGLVVLVILYAAASAYLV